jgi:hypothetical protein
MNMKLKGVITLSLLAGSAWAEPTAPELYTCQGEGVSLIYAATDASKEFKMAILDKLVFGEEPVVESITQTGDAIKAEQTAVGSLVTITRQEVPDSHTDTATLVVPTIRLSETTPTAQFDTPLLFTRNYTTIGGPDLLEGLVQETDTRRVSCEASAQASPKVCGGLQGGACDAGEYCEFSADAACGAADATGICKPKPEICPLIYAPVCGCNGQTYGNSCDAAGAGVSVAHEGECTAN